MKRRKRSPPIPNAEALAAGLREEVESGVGAAIRLASDLALERGRVLGRLEGVIDAAQRCEEGKWLAVGYDSWHGYLLPVLRAEVERLRSGKP